MNITPAKFAFILFIVIDVVIEISIKLLGDQLWC